MVFADHLSQFPSWRENMPIELHQIIHNIHFTPDKLNIIRGATERDPIHSTKYQVTLNGWSERVQEVPHLTLHFMCTRDKLTIEMVYYWKETQCVMRGHSVIYTTTIEALKRWGTSSRLTSTSLEWMLTLLITSFDVISVPSIIQNKESSQCCHEIWQIPPGKTLLLASSHITTKNTPVLPIPSGSTPLCTKHLQKQ